MNALKVTSSTVLVDRVRELESSDGLGVTVLGGGTVAAQLGEAGLVGEYQFVILPVALGGDRTVFTKSRKLRLIDHWAFRSSNVVVT